MKTANRDGKVWHVCRGTPGSVFLPFSECAAPRRAPVLHVWGNAMAERANAVRKAAKSAIPAQTAASTDKAAGVKAAAKARPANTSATASVAKKAPAKKAPVTKAAPAKAAKSTATKTTATKT